MHNNCPFAEYALIISDDENKSWAFYKKIEIRLYFVVMKQCAPLRKRRILAIL
jgi:hypothetical protein